MSVKEGTLIAEAREFLDEICGSGVPLQPLMRTGRFPDGWPTRYLGFVERVSTSYGQSLPLPREIMAVLYAVSVYCTKRYLDWQRITGESDDALEQVVNQVRWAADQFVLSRYWKRAHSKE